MSIEFREVISSVPLWWRDKWRGLPVIKPPLLLPEIDGDTAQLHEYAEQILTTPLDGWQIKRLHELERQQDMWTDWFNENPWPTDDVGEQIQAWKEK